MRPPRRLLIPILLLVALAGVLPAVALAGGSAGNQQYTDPFAGSTSSSSATVTVTSTAATPPPDTTPVVTSSASATTPPPATTPAATTPATSTVRPAHLPFTGYNGWLAAALGAGMVSGGIALRRRTRRA